MPTTEAIPSLLNEAVVFTQKWNIESMPVEQLPCKPWKGRLWAPECQIIQDPDQRRRKHVDVFCPIEHLAISKALKMGTTVLLVFLSWIHFAFLFFWKSFFWVGREEVISETLIISLCHLLNPHVDVPQSLRFPGKPRQCKCLLQITLNMKQP